MVAQYQAEQLLTQRDKISTAVRNELNQRAAEFNILIDDVAITHLSFGAEVRCLLTCGNPAEMAVLVCP